MNKKALVFAIVAIIVVSVIGTREWQRISDASLIQRCAFRGASDSYVFSPEQTGNAATVAGVAIRRGLPKRATTVALAAALQESKLIALDYGDRDSVGLFQQRPSQGWGPRSSLIDPVYSANKFFSALLRIPGWEQLSIADAAQAVQRSADGSAYAAWEQQARVMAEILTSDPYSLTCYLHRFVSSPTPATTRTATLIHDLRSVFKLTSPIQSNADGFAVVVEGERNGQVAAWLVAHANLYGIAEVSANGHSWSRRDWQPNSDNASLIKVRFL